MVRMIGMNGHVVYNKRLDKSAELLQFDIPMAQFKAGTYILQVIGQNKQKIAERSILKL